MVVSFNYLLVMLNGSLSRKSIMNVDVKSMFRKLTTDGLGIILRTVCSNDFQHGSLCTSKSNMENFEYSMDEVRVFTEHYCVCFKGWKKMPQIIAQVRHSMLEVSRWSHLYMTCITCCKIQHPVVWRLKVLLAATSQHLSCNVDLFWAFIAGQRCLTETLLDQYDEAPSFLV